MEHHINKQNDRILATDKLPFDSHSFRVDRTQKPASLMVWAGVTADRRTPLVFIPQGVKINQQVYRESILESVLKPWPKNISKGVRGPLNKTQPQRARPKQLRSG